jgi:hypothetical protein
VYILWLGTIRGDLQSSRVANRLTDCILLWSQLGGVAITLSVGGLVVSGPHCSDLRMAHTDMVHPNFSQIRHRDATKEPTSRAAARHILA